MAILPYALRSVKRLPCAQCGLLTSEPAQRLCAWCLALNAQRDDLQDARTEAALRFGLLPDDEWAGVAE